MTALCDWNPEKSLPAERVAIPLADGTFAFFGEQRGCQSDAVLIVATHGGDYRLCESCARLPCFRAYRKRVIETEKLARQG